MTYPYSARTHNSPSLSRTLISRCTLGWCWEGCSCLAWHPRHHSHRCRLTPSLFGSEAKRGLQRRLLGAQLAGEVQGNIVVVKFDLSGAWSDNDTDSDHSIYAQVKYRNHGGGSGDVVTAVAISAHTLHHCACCSCLLWLWISYRIALLCFVIISTLIYAYVCFSKYI